MDTNKCNNSDDLGLPTPLSIDVTAAAACPDVKGVLDLVRTPANDDQITLPRLIAARKIAANIVAKHGERFLPYFARLNEEVKRRKRDNDDLALALKMAS